MEKCYSKNDVYAIIAERKNYFDEWLEFKNTKQNYVNTDIQILGKRRNNIKNEIQFNKKLKIYKLDFYMILLRYYFIYLWVDYG